MATYVFRCDSCRTRWELTDRDAPGCFNCGARLVRDYRAENVGVAVESLKQERENGGKEGLKRLFLPHNDDFKGPGDPDGTKGMREWRETHQPKAGNKSPDWPGHVEKQVM
jgi:hypothetical protein